MLKKRIIPCLDVQNGRVVKGISFGNLHDAGDPVELAGFYDKEGADELVFLDIGASAEERAIMVEVVKGVSDQVFIPFTVGGGLRSTDDIRRMLQAGADKVSVNTAAVQDPGLVELAAARFGSQCVVAAIDAKKTYSESRGSGRDDLGLESGLSWEVYTHGGRQPTGMDAVKWAKRLTDLGVGEILLTSMDADGHQDGYDIQLTRAISGAVSVPVIASGGAGTLEHLHEALTEGRADAVLVASIFHYGTYSIGQAKEFLALSGLPVRPMEI